MSGLFDLPFEDDAPAAAEPAASAAGARPAVLTVSELTANIRTLLETAYSDVWVEGEISNCRVWNTGHIYFTLKDASAQLRSVMWRSAARLAKFKLEDGLHVIARGRISVYEPKGEYQFVCDGVEPKGLGALQLALEQLKKRLQIEGLLDAARKRPLPTLPRKIGIVTSPDGAALRDIIKVLARRYPNAQLVISPTRVQGEGASAEIAAALDLVWRVEGVDVVIAGRGGGSIEDLWAFNEEPVARAIARCPVPVISAVGHETDVTLADLVADLRAPTPSAAAELVVAGKNEFVAGIDRMGGRLAAAMDRRLLAARHGLQRIEARPAFAGFPARLALRGRHVAELVGALQQAGRGQIARRTREYTVLRQQLDGLDLRRTIARVQTSLAQVKAKLEAGITRRIHLSQARFGAVAARLETLSPLAVLGRGYAVCWDSARGTILTDASAVERGSGVRVTLHRGEIACTVTDVAAPPESEASGPRSGRGGVFNRES